MLYSAHMMFTRAKCIQERCLILQDELKGARNMWHTDIASFHLT